MTDEERLEQTRQIEQEISLLCGQRASLGEWLANTLLNQEFNELNGLDLQEIPIRVRQLCKIGRILAREQAALDELKRGMKEPAP